MHTCPCCSNSLLRHVRHNSLYWYCSHCRQEMPDFTSVQARYQQVRQLGDLVPLHSWSPSLAPLRQMSVISAMG